jgi:hypothetical protein
MNARSITDHISKPAFGVAKASDSVAHPVQGNVCTFAAPPLQSPFHWADKLQLVIHRNGMKSTNSAGIISTSQRLSKKVNKVANSANVSSVSLPIMIFNGIHRLRDCAFVFDGLSRSSCIVSGHLAPQSITLMPPAIIDRFFVRDAPSMDEATDN